MSLPSVTLALLLGASTANSRPMPSFALDNFDGRAFSNASFEGKTTIVVPTYAKCIFACPMITFLLAELDKELGAPPKLQYVHVSVQPREDTEAEILDHFDDHGIDSSEDKRWFFLNGPEEGIQQLMLDTGVVVTRVRVAEGELVEHTIRLFVIGPEGQTLAEFNTYFWNEEEMRHALRFAIAR